VSVAAIIVTFNRRALLEECIAAVEAQTRRVDHVLIVDNASTDGTPELVRERYGHHELLALPTNEGGAGGFHEGMKAGLAGGFEWLWLMDDDTIPNPDALERLLERLDDLGDLPAPSILASRVVWKDGTVHPMNPPGAYLGDIDHFVRAAGAGLIPLRSVTFPSMLVRTAAIRRHRLPQKHFFLWADDIEFTLGILRDEPGYMVPASIAVHKTDKPHVPADGGPRFYYSVRNSFFILRGDTLRPKEKVGHMILMTMQTQQFLSRNRFSWESVKTVLRGALHGLTQRPLR
jgi:rhamnopyranosyl-N-acetylglucosaminyl-diphospho-decaprenol beta-1,3/1,4-galactofuranosyltransferase